MSTRTSHERRHLFPLSSFEYQGERDELYALVPVPLDAQYLSKLREPGAFGGKPWVCAVSVAWYVAIEKSAETREVVLWDSSDPARGESIPVPLEIADDLTFVQACNAMQERRQAAQAGNLATPVAVSAMRQGVGISNGDDKGCPHADITLIVRDSQLAVRFNAARFGKPLVDVIALRVAHLLEQFVAHPDAAIGTAELLSTAERRLLAQLGRGADNPVERSIVEVVRQHSLLQPDRIAIRHADREVSYRELMSASLRTARWLRDNGISTGQIVAVHGAPSPELLFVWFALFALNVTYLTLDSRPAPQRQRRILQDAKASAVISLGEALDDALVGDLPQLRFSWREIEGLPAQPLVQGPQLDAPAYCIFTSGSTGRPKGVLVSHRALAAYCQAISMSVLEGAGDELTFLADLTADLAYTSLYGALFCGRCVRILREDAKLDPLALSSELVSRPVDCMKIVPSHFQALADASGSSAWWPRQTLIFGGEALRSSLIERIRREAPNLRIVNHYGPTETTVGAVANRICDHTRAVNVPLGRPLPGYRTLILNADRQLTPFGHVGELYISGNGCALGYVNDAQLTAERFVSIEASGGEDRWYRTGDLVQMNADGELVFVGRVDDQFKIRGHRVELAEVEHALKSVTGVVDVCITVAGSESARHLVGFYVSETPLSPERVTEQLQYHLPDYMMPSRFERVARLPRTAAGKLDREALLRANLSQPPPLRVEPVDGIDERVTAIWKDLLEQPEVNSSGNFFDMGANSLLIIKARKRIADSLHVDVKLVEFFKYTTIRTLSEHIRRISYSAAAGIVAESERQPVVERQES